MQYKIILKLFPPPDKNKFALICDCSGAFVCDQLVKIKQYAGLCVSHIMIL